MWAERTGPAARSVQKLTASTSTRTRVSTRCETFQPASRRRDRRARGAFFPPPPNPAKMRKEAPAEGAPVGAAELDRVDLELSAGAVGDQADAVLEAEASDRAHSSASAYKACRW